MDTVDPTTLAYILVVVGIANVIGKAIPDTATGVLGIVRKVCKLIGLYTPNRA